MWSCSNTLSLDVRHYTASCDMSRKRVLRFMPALSCSLLILPAPAPALSSYVDFNVLTCLPNPACQLLTTAVSVWAPLCYNALAIEQEIAWTKILGGSETLCYNAIAIVFNKTSLERKYLGNDLNNTFYTQIIFLNDLFWNTYSTNCFVHNFIMIYYHAYTCSLIFYNVINFVWISYLLCYSKKKLLSYILKIGRLAVLCFICKLVVVART